MRQWSDYHIFINPQILFSKRKLDVGRHNCLVCCHTQLFWKQLLQQRTFFFATVVTIHNAVVAASSTDIHHLHTSHWHTRMLLLLLLLLLRVNDNVWRGVHTRWRCHLLLLLCHGSRITGASDVIGIWGCCGCHLLLMLLLLLLLLLVVQNYPSSGKCLIATRHWSTGRTHGVRWRGG